MALLLPTCQFSVSGLFSHQSHTQSLLSSFSCSVQDRLYSLFFPFMFDSNKDQTLKNASLFFLMFQGERASELRVSIKQVFVQLETKQTLSLLRSLPLDHPSLQLYYKYDHSLTSSNLVDLVQQEKISYLTFEVSIQPTTTQTHSSSILATLLLLVKSPTHPFSCDAATHMENWIQKREQTPVWQSIWIQIDPLFSLELTSRSLVKSQQVGSLRGGGFYTNFNWIPLVRSIHSHTVIFCPRGFCSLWKYLFQVYNPELRASVFPSTSSLFSLPIPDCFGGTNKQVHILPLEAINEVGQDTSVTNLFSTKWKRVLFSHSHLYRDDQPYAKHLLHIQADQVWCVTPSPLDGNILYQLSLLKLQFQPPFSLLELEHKVDGSSSCLNSSNYSCFHSVFGRKVDDLLAQFYQQKIVSCVPGFETLFREKEKSVVEVLQVPRFLNDHKYFLSVPFSDIHFVDFPLVQTPDVTRLLYFHFVEKLNHLKNAPNQYKFQKILTKVSCLINSLFCSTSRLKFIRSLEKTHHLSFQPTQIQPYHFQDPCMVCFEKTEIKVSLLCNHALCYLCARKLIQQKVIPCPVCRTIKTPCQSTSVFSSSSAWAPEKFSFFALPKIKSILSFIEKDKETKHVVLIDDIHNPLLKQEIKREFVEAAFPFSVLYGYNMSRVISFLGLPPREKSVLFFPLSFLPFCFSLFAHSFQQKKIVFHLTNVLSGFSLFIADLNELGFHPSFHVWAFGSSSLEEVMASLLQKNLLSL